MVVNFDDPDVRDDLIRCMNFIFTQNELANKYGVTRSRIKNEIRKLRLKLKAEQENEEISRKRKRQEDEIPEDERPRKTTNPQRNENPEIHEGDGDVDSQSDQNQPQDDVRGMKTKYLNERLIVVRTKPNVNYTFFRGAKKVSKGWYYSCNGCHQARYGARNAAKKAGREEVQINRGSTKNIVVDQGEIVADSGLHHRECQPLTDMQVAIREIERKRQEFIDNEQGSSFDAFIHTLFHTLPETAEQYGIAEIELAKNLPIYSKARKIAQQRKRRKNPNFDPFKHAELLVKPFNSNWYCSSDKAMGIVLLTTPEDRQYLKKSQSWVIDATFDVRAQGFSQMLVIHVKIGSNYGPVVHVLMKKRTAKEYYRVFEMLEEAIGGLTHPKQIITDFERALRSAIKRRFPETKLYGCMFHHAQAILRKLSSLGLKAEYNKHLEFHDWVGQVIALKMVPLKYAKKLWYRRLIDGPPLRHDEEGVHTYPEAVNKMVDYVQKNWIPLNDDDEEETEIWGHYTNEGPRTTNVAEAYHSRLHRHDAPKHPTYPTFLNFMLKIHSMDSHTFLRWEAGCDRISPSKVYDELNKKVKAAKDRFDRRLQELENTSIEYLVQLWCDEYEEPDDHDTIEFLVWNAHKGYENVGIYDNDIRELVEDEIMRRQLSHIAHLLARPSEARRERRRQEEEERRFFGQTAKEARQEENREQREKGERRKSRHKGQKETKSQSSPPSAPKPATAHIPTQSPTLDLSQPDFIRWGAPGYDNPCPVECLLQSIIYHMMEVPEWVNALPIGNDNDELGKRDKEFRQMVLLFQQRKPIEAKLFILDKLANDPEQDLPRSITGTINLVGNERDRLIKRYKHVWTRSEQSYCVRGCKRTKITILPELILQNEDVRHQLCYFFRNHDAEQWQRPVCGAPITESGQSETCAGELMRTVMLWAREKDRSYAPWMLPFEITNYGTIQKCLGLVRGEEPLPLKISYTVNNDVYRLVGITMCNSTQETDTVGHITAIIRWKGNFLLYDGLNMNMVPYQQKDIENRTPQFAYYFLLPGRRPTWGSESPQIGSPQPPDWWSPPPVPSPSHRTVKPKQDVCLPKQPFVT